MLGKFRKAGLLLKAGFLVLTFAGINSSWACVLDEPKAHPAIPLLDESGSHVLDSGKPYSSRRSCGTGGCHDYDAITHAFQIAKMDVNAAFLICTAAKWPVPPATSAPTAPSVSTVMGWRLHAVEVFP